MTYIVFDSRATPDDNDDASVLEVIDDADSDDAAIAAARECWPKQRAMLFAYRTEGKNLVDERFVGCVDDYESFPRKRKASKA